MRKWLCAAVALGTVLLTGLISAAPAMARDGQFSCRASALRIGPIEPITAGNNAETPNDPTDASRPCNPQSSSTPSYNGPEGCYFVLTDPNCFNPNRVSLGLLYATTEECRNMRPASDPQREPGNPANPPQDPPEFCRSGAPAFPDPNVPARDNDGVKARAGVADLFLTAGGQPSNTSPPTANFLHLSAVNAFADVRCANGQAEFDARSQVVFVNLGNQLALDVVPGLIPGVSGATSTYNNYRTAGPFRFNATYINDNEPGGAVSNPMTEGQPQGLHPTTGRVRFDRDPSGALIAPGTIYKITQRAVELTSSGGNAASTIVAGEATVDIAENARQLAANEGACRPDAGRGTITVAKQTDVEGDPTVFTIRDHTGAAVPMSDNGSRTSGPLPPGPYTVSEDDHPDYTESVTCTETGGTANTTTTGRQANITLEANEAVVCTFTNTRGGTPNPNVIIRKNTVPDGPQDFSFTGSGTIGNFQLDDDGDATLPNQRGFTVAPGEYTVTETAVSGYRTSVRCSDPSRNSRGEGRTARINVAANEVVTCTFTNRQAKKPPKCDRDDDGDDDHDRDRDGNDDRDRDHDGKDDRNGKRLKRNDRNRDGKDDECERDRKERRKCEEGHKRSKKSDNDDDRGRREGRGDRRGDRDDDRGQCRNKKSKKSKKSKR